MVRLHVGAVVWLVRWWELPEAERSGVVVESLTGRNPFLTVRLESGELVTLHRRNLLQLRSRE